MVALTKHLCSSVGCGCSGVGKAYLGPEEEAVQRKEKADEKAAAVTMQVMKYEPFIMIRY